MGKAATRYLRDTSASTNPADGAALVGRFEQIREQQKVPGDFPAEVLAEAEQAAAAVRLPERDETAAEFVTIDPPTSKDLDQAMLLERSGSGYRVRYAIADVPAFVRPGGALDTETRRRVETIYCPDKRVPLHPTSLSEGAASLLEGQVRPAFVWDLTLDSDGETTRADIYRAAVKSYARLDYGGVQRDIDSGAAAQTLLLLKEIGEKRIDLERARGGASLPTPEQDVTLEDDGTFTLAFRPMVASEDWNAQISLMTGMAAADLMLAGSVGILRTMPDPDPRDIARFRRQAQALGVPWPSEVPYGEFLRTLDRSDPRQLAIIHAATRLFRGAGYTPFDGVTPEHTTHSAVAAPYAHVTAPLRRLVDRFGLVVCAALAAGQDVPDWCRQALPTLPDLMKAGDTMASAVERACTDAVEAAVLSSRVGQTLSGSVVDVPQGRQGDGAAQAGASHQDGQAPQGSHPESVTVQLLDPPVVGRANGQARAGDEVDVRVDAADIATSQVSLTLVEGPAVEGSAS